MTTSYPATDPFRLSDALGLKTLRFAGGRARLSKEIKMRCLSIGFNGGIVGDLLTTLGTTVREDIDVITECGYKF